MAGDNSTAAPSGSIFSGGNESSYEDQSYSPPAPSYTPSPGDGGEGGNSGGGGKIVCTMMNELLRLWII